MSLTISRATTLGPGITLISSPQVYAGYAYSYRYWKFQPTEIYDPNTENNTVWQIGKFNLMYRGQNISYAGASASMTAGAVYSPSEGPANAINNNFSTKLCVQGSEGGTSGSSGLGWALIIDMGHAVMAQSFTYATATDAPGRDPICWIVWGSNDESTWVPVQMTQGFTPISARETYVGTSFPFNSPYNTHIQVPTVTGGLNGDNSYTAWTTPNANGVDNIPVGAIALGNNDNNLIGGIYTVTTVTDDRSYSHITVEGRTNSTIFGKTVVGSNLPFDVYFTATTVSNGLLLHLDSRNSLSWPGSGTTWYDLSGNGNNATFYSNPSMLNVGTGPGVVEGTAIDGSTLISGGDIYFNGTSGTGQYQYAAGPNLSTNLLTWTISAWFKANSLVSTSELPAIFTGIYTGYNAGSPFGQSVNYTLAFYNGVGNDNNLYGGFYQPGSWQLSTPGAAITPGTWYNGVVTYDGATINFYINNTLVSSKSGVYSTSLVSGLGYHVARRWDGYDSFDGYVPVVMAYNRPLTTDELTQNFTAYRGQYGV